MKLPNVTKLFKWLSANWNKVTPYKVYSWAMAYFRMNKTANQTPAEPSEGPSPIYWETEQFEWRVDRVSKVSPKCLEGACVQCGCETPDKFWEEDSCEHGCYPTWLNKKDWERMKRKP